MTVDKTMMLGVVGLGILATYLLGKSGDRPEGPGTSPATPGGGGGSDPPRPSGQGLTMLGDPLKFKAGQYYRGRLLVGDNSLPPFNLNAGPELITKGLGALGFDDVRVFMGVAELPKDWPASTMVNPVAGTRWFMARWAQPAIEVPRPWNMEMIWVTASPGLVAARAASSGVGCGCAGIG